MSKFKKIIKIIVLVIVLLFFIFGIPIIINECYKTNCGYLTIWDASAVLGYYGTILGVIITVVTVVATISFTKKQIQRESFFKLESEKWYKLKSLFLEILESINPIVVLKDVMENGFANPTKAINTLQRYQINCKTSTDLLNAHLNGNDYPKVKHLIDGIAEITEVFVNISDEEIKQYSDYRILQIVDLCYQIIEIEKKRPGSISKEELIKCYKDIENSKTINVDRINSQLKKSNSEFIRVYESKYRNLLQGIGATFERIETETIYEADRLLNFGIKNKLKFSNKKSDEKKNIDK